MPWWVPDFGWWVFVYTSEVLAREAVGSVADALAQGLVLSRLKSTASEAGSSQVCVLETRLRPAWSGVSRGWHCPSSVWTTPTLNQASGAPRLFCALWGSSVAV